MLITNPRALSALIVQRVCYHATSLTDAFLIPEFKPYNDDNAFVKELCFGTIRFWIQLQAILKQLLEKPLKNSDKDIECLLCVGLYQILYMRIADYAIVDETVTATRALKKAWASKLVNKILRMTISDTFQSTLSQLKEKSITTQYAHPNWIIDKIQSDFPEYWSDILNNNNKKAPLFLRVNSTKTTLEKFQQKLLKQKIKSEEVSGLSCAIKLTEAMPVEKIPGFSEGLFSVQDVSGQKVLDYLDLNEDHRMLDACAAPGSKTTHILENFPNIKLTAIDISENRLKKIKENCLRLRVSQQHLKLIAADASDVSSWWNKELFDRILLDAPCSASGVIRRHPDIKILRKKTDIKNLSEQQSNLLEKLWETLKTEGKLIYTTCSVFSDENEKVIEEFLASHTDAKTIPINNKWGINLKYGQQVITDDLDRDGFYYCVIQKCVDQT